MRKGNATEEQCSETARKCRNPDGDGKHGGAEKWAPNPRRVPFSHFPSWLIVENFRPLRSNTSSVPMEHCHVPKVLQVPFITLPITRYRKINRQELLLVV